MSSEFERAESLFHAARDLPPTEREAYVREGCGGDETLARRVLRLLEIDANATRLATPSHLRGGPGAELEAGTVVGSYRLVRLLGEGGCGTVYLAEQIEPIRRTVALKLIRGDMSSPEVIARFELERQAIGMMNHPNIAAVYDAGRVADGRPYFVMEYVDGEPITEYCDSRRLGVRERLALFVRVCDAVQHAHQKAVIHRDIKPSNVLVSGEGAAAVPKVIDFGVAKALELPMRGVLETLLGQPLGTPEYMSPEQADPRGEGVDTRSDVYSLGVLLYQLLTGALPFSSSELRSAGLAEIQRIIREVDPPTPSARLSHARVDATGAASARRTAPRTLLTALRGDLDWIVMKCLEKDRARRYATAAMLGAEVESFLRGDAVAARPPSLAYRGRKLLRKHWRALAVATSIAASLVFGIIATGLAAYREAAAAEDAQRSAELAQGQAQAARDAEEGARQAFAGLRAAHETVRLQLAGNLMVQANLVLNADRRTRSADVAFDLVRRGLVALGDHDASDSDRRVEAHAAGLNVLADLASWAYWEPKLSMEYLSMTSLMLERVRCDLERWPNVYVGSHLPSPMPLRDQLIISGMTLARTLPPERRLMETEELLALLGDRDVAGDPDSRWRVSRDEIEALILSDEADWAPPSSVSAEVCRLCATLPSVRGSLVLVAARLLDRDPLAAIDALRCVAESNERANARWPRLLAPPDGDIATAIVALADGRLGGAMQAVDRIEETAATMGASGFWFDVIVRAADRLVQHGLCRADDAETLTEHVASRESLRKDQYRSEVLARTMLTARTQRLRQPARAMWLLEPLTRLDRSRAALMLLLNAQRQCGWESEERATLRRLRRAGAFPAEMEPRERAALSMEFLANGLIDEAADALADAERDVRLESSPTESQRGLYRLLAQSWRVLEKSRSDEEFAQRAELWEARAK